MEVYRVSTDSVKHFKTLFNQNGRGLDLDRYIYHQRGAGIGSFFAKLFHKVLPVAKSAIKGVLKTAAPYAKGFAQDLGKQGVEHATTALSNYSKRKRDNLDHE
jgi:hypothetical protein